jgi:hypothetical protein
MAIIVLIRDRTISNLLHAVAKVSIEFPRAKSIDSIFIK